MKKISTCLLALFLLAVCTTVTAQRQTINILSTNDMHSAIEQMPKLASIADSLRKIDPDLIVLSGGDNRTGNPYNDMYEVPAYPMVALMNAVGFNASAIGNHEWDNNWTGFRTVTNLASFPFLCCNAAIPDSMNLKVKPYMFINVKGVKIGILGAIQTGENGLPDSHPKNLKGITFRKADDVIPEYKWMRDQCDVFILLSHDGYEEDVETAKLYPFFDQIVGGHSHTLTQPNDIHNGVLITQVKNKLANATHTTITVEDGKVVSKTSEIIDIKNRQSYNEDVDKLLQTFMVNPKLEEVLGNAEADFNNYEELGCLMCDAILEGTNSDISLQNGGGVRFDKFLAGPMTVNNVLQLDPFGNEAIVYEITGKEIGDLIMKCFSTDSEQTPYVGGITYEMLLDKNHKPTSITMKTLDGKKLDLKKKYRFVTNSYVSAILPAPKSDAGTSTFQTCSDLIMDYIKKKETVNYQGVCRAVIKQ